MASMIEAFEAIDHDRPVCFIAYTIKGRPAVPGPQGQPRRIDDADADGKVARVAKYPARARVGEIRGIAAERRGA
jgi:hypothetical protein